MSVKNKYLTNLGVAILLFIIIVAFIIYPTMKKIFFISNRINQEQQELEKRLTLGWNIKKTQQDLNRTKQSVTELNKALIEKNQELSFITNLETLATANQISLNINSDLSSQKINGIEKLIIQMNIKGGYHQILKFLQAVEAMPNYYNINIINTITNKQENDTITMQLIGTTYLQSSSL